MAVRIRRARLNAGFSQTHLAGMLGVHRSAVAQWEKAEKATSPSVVHLVELANITRVAFEWLATGRGKSEMAPEIANVDIGVDEIELQCLEAVRRVPKRRREALCRLLLQLTS